MNTRVVVVDDSPFVRAVLRDLLGRYPDLEIVGEAGDGASAERIVAQLRPDVVTMDVVMPLVSGLDAIRAIMARTPTPIVVLSDARGGVDRLMLEATTSGAVDVVVKPTRGFDEQSAAQLAATLRTAAKARVTPREAPAPMPQSWDAARKQLENASIIGVVASTGGPQLLHEMIRALPPQFHIPIAIVQHTTIGFTKPLVAWLGDHAPVPVSLAVEGQQARGVVIAPDDQHLVIDRRGIIGLHRDPPIRGHRPSGTVLLSSLAVHQRRAVGVVCTGMNDDGSAGLAALAAAGGLAIVEDPRTAVVDSMPRMAKAATPTALVATLKQLSELFRSVVRTP